MRCKYKVRWFASKGALLVLVWTMLISIASALSAASFYQKLDSTTRDPFILVSSLSLSSVLLVAPLTGWIADSKLGNHKMFRFGIVFLFISMVVNCLFLLLESLVWENSLIVNRIHFIASGVIFMIGVCVTIVVIISFGLDQMPDASASNIESFIVWISFSFFLGTLLYEITSQLRDSCLPPESFQNYNLILSSIATLCMSIVLISNYLFRPKWLILEPKSPQSLKTIYNIIKFAVKHKAPLNRSAFTYWEEDIPSRIDLAKTKYGGPFSTEQVEDVKTVLRLLMISIPFSLIYSFFTLHILVEYGPFTKNFPGLNSCSTNAIFLFTYSSSWFSILAPVVNEFVVIPSIGKKLPSILKRLCIASSMTSLVSLICFVLELVHYFSDSKESVTEWIIQVIFQSTDGILSFVLITLMIEFLCAQSPYKMRGLLVSFVLSVIAFSIMVDKIVSFFLFQNNCKPLWCPLVLLSVKTCLCSIALLLFCIAARWYKVRVRDEEYFPQTVVEEVYDRYLTAAAMQSTSYEAIN